MSDEAKEIIESQMNDMRTELADIHMNVGRILECLDTMSEVLDRGMENGFTTAEIKALRKLYYAIYNSAKRV